ncbi:hypothetical protein BDF19DRAFT_425813 [Syncephalis fuscata]|nr:hypothetical protein BDF19DRAFT_425813 [Syncephalis fuscata]
MTTVAQKPVSGSGPEGGKSSSAGNHRSKHSKGHGSSGHGQRQHRRLIGSFQLGKTLGAGSMGKVKLAQHVVTGKKAAVKIIPRALPTQNPDGTMKPAKDADNKEVRVVREAAILQLLHHPNVVALKEFIVHPRHFYLAFEYVSGGQMLDYIISHGRLKERVARKFLRQMVSAIDYCHRNSIVHRDLKIENILISSSGSIKLIDFGLANLYSPRSHLSTFCGSLYFAAPELLNARPYIGPEVPFDDQSMPMLHAKIKRGHVEYPEWLSKDCVDLLSQMLVVDPSRRAMLRNISNHPWMIRGYGGPPENHVPEREPLALPLDLEVIRRMRGFDFGPEGDILHRLEEVVTAWTDRRRLAAECRWRWSSGVEDGALDAVSTESDPNEVTLMDELDPIVSIYYLVRERIEREKRGEPTGFDEEEGVREYRVDINDADAIASAAINNANAATADIGEDDSGSPESAEWPVVHTEMLKGADGSKSPKQTEKSGARFRRAVSDVVRLARGKEEDKETTADNNNTNLVVPNLATSPNNSSRSANSSGNGGNSGGGIMRRISLVVGSAGRRRLVKKRADTTRDVFSDDEDERLALERRHSTTPMHLLRRPGSGDQLRRRQSTKSANSARQEEENELRGRSFGRRLTRLLSRRSPNGSGTRNGRRSRLPSISTPEASVAIPEEAVGASKLLAPDATLSEGSMTPSAHGDSLDALTSTVSPKSDVLAMEDTTVDAKVKTVFLKGLFSVNTTSTRSPKKIRIELLAALEAADIGHRESRGRIDCWLPLDAADPRLGPEAFDTDAAGISGDIDKPDNLKVWFEVSIVRTPWLPGMCGIRFRRVAGDSWLYRESCQKILETARL